MMGTDGDGGTDPTEFDLACANCDGSLARSQLDPERLGVDASQPLSIAECRDCGDRYYPRETLERL